MRKTAWLIALVFILGGCEQPSREQPEPDKPEVKPLQQSPALAQWYRERASSQRKTLEIRARTFREAVRGLLDEPDAERLATARETWRGLYESFNRAWLALRISARYESGLEERLRRCDPVPIFPGYIDGLRQWPDSGIVHDPTVKLTRQSLLEQQGATAEGEASLGFPVIHFLLHGEPDRPRQATAFRVPARKQPADEQPDRAQPQSSAPPDVAKPSGKDPSKAIHRSELSPKETIQRRRDYLRVTTRVLTRDLQTLATASTPAPAPQVLVASLRPLLQRLIRLEGLSEANEVAGEYMAPATREQAVAVLLESLKGWLDADTPFMRVLTERAGSTGALRERVDAIDGPGDVEALQALHAELAAMGDRLGRNPGRSR